MKKIIFLLISMLLIGCSSSINTNNKKYQNYLSLLQSADKGQMHIITDLPVEGYSFNNEIDLYLDFQGDEGVEKTASMLYETIIPFVKNTKLGNSSNNEDMDHFHDYLIIFTLDEDGTKISYTIWNDYTISIEDNDTLFKYYDYYSCDKNKVDKLIDEINTAEKERMDLIQNLYFK